MPSRRGSFFFQSRKERTKETAFVLNFTALYLLNQESDQNGPLPNPVAGDGSGFEKPRLPFCQLLDFEAKGWGRSLNDNMNEKQAGKQKV